MDRALPVNLYRIAERQIGACDAVVEKLALAPTFALAARASAIADCILDFIGSGGSLEEMACVLSRLCSGLSAGWVMAFAMPALGAEAARKPPPPLANAVLAPALKAAAERDHILLFNLDPTGPEPLEGDSAVAWIGTSDAKSTRQWLIQFRRGVITPAERKSAQDRDKKKYLSWGPVVTFKSEAEALELWIAGPVATTAALKAEEIAPVKRARILVPADYLRLGLDNSLRVDQHLRRRFEALRKEDPKFKASGIYVLDQPIPPEKIAAAKRVADKIEFTPEMERAWIGGFIALEAFYRLANEVPEIEAIAEVAVEKPPVWKLAKLATGTHFMTSLGGPNTRPAEPAKLGLVPVPMETLEAPFAFSFDRVAIVAGTLVVTSPTPPLDTTAGILALLAIHPKDATRQVHIAVISSVRGKPAPTK